MNATSPTVGTLGGRTHYRSSGAINAGAFLVWLVPALAVAVLLAGFMYWLVHVGHYYIIIVPLICALAVAGLARLAVGRGHCRNPLAALLAGLFLGAILYLGSYYIGMICQVGSEVATRPDVFVRYIRLRMATDVVRDTSSPRRNERRSSPRSGSSVMNWVRFGLELIGVLAIVAASAWRRSRKPYCEQCRRWLVRETSPFEPSKAEGIIESLQTGGTRGLAAICASPPYATIPNTTMAVDYCPSLKERTGRDCPAYLSLKAVTANLKGATLDTFEHSKGKMLERSLQLNPDELPALAPRFPVFEAWAGRAAVASLLPPEAPVTSPEAAAKPPGQLAEITALDPEHRGKVLTRRVIWAGNGFAIAGLVSFLGGLGLLAWGASILDRTAAAPAGLALCIIGGGLTLMALAGMIFDSSFGANRFLRKKFIAELSRRTGVLVDPTDPDAVFVEVVPKLNWGKTMLENASDIGLLVVDKGRRELRFEGDHERWRVPGASISQSDIESYVHGQGAGATKYFYVVLRAARSDGFWEAPVRERRGSGLLTSRRKKLAKQLAAAIEGIRR